MNQLTAQVSGFQYPLFMKILKRFAVVSYQPKAKVVFEEDSEKEIEQNLQQGFKELNLVLQGKLKARPVRELLNEL